MSLLMTLLIVAAANIKYNIYSKTWSNDATIKDELDMPLYFVDFKKSFTGSWTVKFQEHTADAITIDKGATSNAKIVDLESGFSTYLLKSGLTTRTFEFRAQDDKTYVWKSTGFTGNMKMYHVYNQKVVLAFFSGSTLTIHESLADMKKIILATGFAAARWDREHYFPYNR